MNTESSTLYAAYGSNLNLRQMAQRCPTAKVMGGAKLAGYRLLFRGDRGGAVATVEKEKGCSVPVLVWKITPQDEVALDRYEGYPWLYRKETVKVRYKGKWVEAMIYIMNEGRPLGSPSRYYFEVIKEGYVNARFDLAIFVKAVRDSTCSTLKRGEIMDKTLFTDRIVEQIMAIRTSGEINMFDIKGVQHIAHGRQFYELVVLLEEFPEKYTEFILHGKK